jgi:8-amino-7-oxononanoate synthase
MLDFTSALYLGLRHASGSLRPWAQLTTGAPAALAAPAGAGRIADRLAALIGCDRATVAPSTLHLFWDLFGMLSGDGIAIYMDAGVYPIARWGIERATARGVPLHTFPHDDVAALRSLLRRNKRSRLSPVVVTDGFCPGCGVYAPIAAYLESVRDHDGQVIVDDTQALGIFGHSPEADAPYGLGGGGSLRRWNVSDEDVIVISSLAKGFGVPMAVMAGSEATIARFEERSETRVHCSPPSIATIHAAEHALDVNDVHGMALRLRLVQNVWHFRTRLAEPGLAAIGGLFPVQTLRLKPEQAAIEVHQRLRDYGIETVLHRAQNGSGPCLSFILTARHRRSEIDRAVEALERALAIKSAPRQAQAEHG